MLKIDVFSDLHLDHWITKVYKGQRATEVLREFIKQGKSDADTVIFAGDAGNGYHWYTLVLKTLREFYTHVLAAPGNHDFYGTEGFTKHAKHYTSGYLNGTVFERGEFATCPLWTNFRNKPGFGELASKQISDYFAIPELLHSATPWELTMEANAFYREQLLAARPDIVVTHFAPSRGSEHPKYAGQALNTYFVNDDDSLVHQVNADLWVHGHGHDEFDYYVGTTHIVSFPIGYPFENFSELIGIKFKTVQI